MQCCDARLRSTLPDVCAGVAAGVRGVLTCTPQPVHLRHRVCVGAAKSLR